jgi:hypothetical protein
MEYAGDADQPKKVSQNDKHRRFDRGAEKRFVMNLADSDLNLFARLGILKELLALAGVERVTDREARDRYGITGLGDMSGIVFPYIDPRDGRRKTARLRRDNPEIEAGQPKRKYLSAHGDRRHLYFPPGSEKLLADPTVPIILVEAEKSSLALTAFAQRVERKYVPIAMGGCWSWRGRIGKVENSRGERVDEMGPLPDLSYASRGRKVIILLDANVNTNTKVQRARRALHAQLINQGASVFVAELPQTEGVNGPDDFIGIAGDDAMATVLDAAYITTEEKSKGQMIAKGQAQALLLELGKDIEFFHTVDQDAFASVYMDGHWETFPVAGRQFALVLLHRYYSSTSSAPPKQALEGAISVFTSRALFDGAQRPVFLRVAERDGEIYVDLADSTWEAAGISTAGWRMVTNPPVKFVRSPGMRPLPAPMVSGHVNELRSFVNVADEDWPLVLTWILAAYRRRGPFPILMLNGEQGSCKSSACVVLRNLIDPNAASLRSGPRDERDLFVSASNSWVITLDNLSYLPDWLSDSLCRLATGGGFSTRQLYSDLNETIIDVQRPIILNGIAELATRGDLLDRSIVISLPTMDAEKRRDEAEFRTAFESAKPRLFGALLDVLSAALAELQHTKLARKPRMADFALFGVAVERACGWPLGTFIKAYEGNRAAANASAIEASPVALAIQALVAEERTFENTATELLQKLFGYADEQARSHRSWPDSGWKLSRILRRLAPNLRASGVDVIIGDRTPDHKRSRIVRIGRTASAVSDASVSPQNQPITRTQSDASTSTSDGAFQPCQRSRSTIACLSDAPGASDALAQPSMVRGEV